MAGRKIRVKLKNRPKGEMIQILHLGAFENGKESEITPEQLDNFEAQTGAKWPTGVDFDGHRVLPTELFSEEEVPIDQVEAPESGTVQGPDAGGTE